MLCSVELLVQKAGSMQLGRQHQAVAAVGGNVKDASGLVVPLVRMIGAVAGPRRLDCHQAQRVQGQTLARYRAAALPFSTWLLSTGTFPVGAEDWDDLLVEYKNEFDLSQASFAQLVSSIDSSSVASKGP